MIKYKRVLEILSFHDTTQKKFKEKKKIKFTPKFKEKKKNSHQIIMIVVRGSAVIN